MKQSHPKGKTQVGIIREDVPVVSPSLIQSPTATITAAITIVMAGLTSAGVAVPWLAVATPIIVAAGIVSMLNPRWAKARGIFFQRPALLTGAIAYLLVFVSEFIDKVFGTHLNLTTDITFVVIGGIMSLVGFAFPKNGLPKWVAFLLPSDT